MLCQDNSHFIGVKHLPNQGLRELFYKVWAVEHAVHRGVDDPRYTRHLASALAIPQAYTINGFFGSKGRGLETACTAAARRLGGDIKCESPRSLCEILKSQKADMVLVRIGSQDQYTGKPLLNYAKRFGGKTHVVCFQDCDFAYLRWAIATLKVSRAYLFVPGGEWFLNYDEAWMYEMIALALLLLLLRPDFCTAPPIAF